MPSRAGGSPCDFLPGMPLTTRIFSPGCSVNPGSMTPRIEPRLPLRALTTCMPPVLTATAPSFSRTKYSSLIRFESGAACASRNTSAIAASDLQDLALFFAQDLVDLGHRLVGRLLHLLQAVALVVLGHRAVLQELLDHLVGVATRAPQRHPGVFAHLLHQLHQLLPPLLRQGRHGQAHDLAVRAGVEAQLAAADRLLDLGDQRALPRLDGDEPR